MEEFYVEAGQIILCTTPGVYASADRCVIGHFRVLKRFPPARVMEPFLCEQESEKSGPYHHERNRLIRSLIDGGFIEPHPYHEWFLGKMGRMENETYFVEIDRHDYPEIGGIR